MVKMRVKTRVRVRDEARVGGKMCRVLFGVLEWLISRRMGLCPRLDILVLWFGV